MKKIRPFLVILALSVPALASDSLLPTAQIRNVQFGALLRPVDASTKTGAPLVLYPAQPWKCMTWKIQGGGDSCQLINVFSNKPFAADSSGVIHQAAADTESRWKILLNDDGTYRILDASGKALTATGEGHVILSEWKGDAAQKWRIEKKDVSELTM